MNGEAGKRFGAGPEPPVPGVDPAGPEKGSYRVLRGGGWDNVPEYCRSAVRGGFTPTNRYTYVGFRVAAR